MWYNDKPPEGRPPSYQPPPLPPRPHYKRALWLTFGVIGGLCVLSMAGATGPQGNAAALYYLWYVAALVWLVAFPLGLALLFRKDKQIGSGILTGAALGFLALAVSCFANIATLVSQG